VTTIHGATVADLRPVDLFDDLSDAELEPWAAATEVRELPPGEIVHEQGEPGTGVHFLLAGRLRVSMLDGDRVEPIGHQEAPTWLGAIAALTHGDAPVRMETESDARVATIGPDAFERLALADVRVHRRVMAQISPVMNRLTAIEQNRERLAALGTMAAGLAHELNNPAAAAKRSSAELGEALEVLTSAVANFVEAGVSREAAGRLVDLQREALANAAAGSVLDALDAADAEEELAERLEDYGVVDAYRLAEPLATAQVDAGWLERVEAIAGPASGAAIVWVAASLNARSLTAELADSTDRISDLVKAVKTYAYMDRGELVEVDVHEGLQTTLKVLGHKLKHTQIQVVREYDRELPKVMVRGAELNQVWTNLLDNAICALGDTGTITVRTRRDGACLEVDVADDGPGIPPENLDRIFEPFFTTKPVGSGTGLGLDTSRRIVVDRHDGSIRVRSQPGETVFTVRLPMGGPQQ
jgi:signal transduction histidine kinase